jgi:hypothetical protein
MAHPVGADVDPDGDVRGALARGRRSRIVEAERGFPRGPGLDPSVGRDHPDGQALRGGSLDAALHGPVGFDRQAELRVALLAPAEMDAIVDRLDLDLRPQPGHVGDRRRPGAVFAHDLAVGALLQSHLDVRGDSDAGVCLARGPHGQRRRRVQLLAGSALVGPGFQLDDARLDAEALLGPRGVRGEDREGPLAGLPPPLAGDGGVHGDLDALDRGDRRADPHGVQVRLRLGLGTRERRRRGEGGDRDDRPASGPVHAPVSHASGA